MTDCDFLSDVRDYFTGRVTAYGATPRGVDWNSAAAQCRGFEQVLRVCEGSRPFVLGDYGCGYGALYEYLLTQGFEGAYRGFDISPAMLDAGRQRFESEPRVRFGADDEILADADFIVACGVFNLKLQTPEAAWEKYVLQSLDRIASLARRGFAFNALTSYSDAERMRADLYYPDPCVLFDYCKRHHSKRVALLHDYWPYEFTILVRHGSGN